MKFTLNWLKEFLDTDASLEQITEKLTALGLEVEEVVDRAAALAPFRIAQIKDAKPHPDADKLRVCRVATGEEELQIVCGAPNARAGINVVLAPIGAVIPTNDLKIRASKIRGVESFGMLCSAAELGLGEDHNGIIEMPANDNVIGQPYANLVGLDDPVIEIAITPNRGDCLGVYGIARDLAAAGLGILKPLAPTQERGNGASPINIKIEDENLCPYFIGRHFKNVKNAQSPAWLKQRLEAIGLRPISALVDITNYIAFTFGRPLHVYDAAKLKGNLTIARASGGEKFEALDDKDYMLKKDIPIVADENGAQAIAGVIGGRASGCELDTTEVFLEVALFDADEVAKAGRAMDILSDSRYRFERRVDPLFLETATDIATQMILELCGGQASEITVAGKRPEWKKHVNFTAKNVAEIGGVHVDEAICNNILSALEFEINGDKISIPSWRPDVEGTADIVEEILRVHGYEHIPTTELPRVNETKETAVTAEQSRIYRARRALSAHGMKEVVSWSFMPFDIAKKFGFKDEGLMLANPISSDLDAMRPSILPNLLQAVARNAARGYKDLAFFEAGPIFEQAKPKGQSRHVSGVRSNEYVQRNTHETARVVDVFDAKADLLLTLEAMGAPTANLQISNDAPSYYHPGRSGVFKLGKNALAVFGEIHPSILKLLDIKFPVVAFETFADALPPVKRKGKSRCKLIASDFQSSVRDFAVLVDTDVKAESILRAALGADKKLIKDATIFDVYQGKNIEDGKKSVAFSIRIQPDDRTLNEKELEEIQQKVLDAVVKQTGAVLR